MARVRGTWIRWYGHWLLVELGWWYWETGWWFQIFFIFTPKIGEDEPILTHIFQRGWDHHLGNSLIPFRIPTWIPKKQTSILTCRFPPSKCFFNSHRDFAGRHFPQVWGGEVLHPPSWLLQPINRQPTFFSYRSLKKKHTIHGTGILIPTWKVDFFWVNVGRYTVRPMDHMGV